MCFFLLNRINRGEPQQQSSNVHFFTSHLMTTLKDKGPKEISKWIKNININVFEKKLVFIPINADSHWSLGVVVNPGLIENSFDNDLDPNKEHTLYMCCATLFEQIHLTPKFTLPFFFCIAFYISIH